MPDDANAMHEDASDDAPPRGCPQVKICGLTVVEEAVACAEAGADAIGCVFYPQSPRHLADDAARAICRALPARVCPVGVFVDETFSGVMRRVEHCGLRAVQVHGRETPQLVEELRSEGIIVIKGLFMKREPFIRDAGVYGATAYLVECGAGRLPGGNAEVWNWGEAVAAFPLDAPLALAGGLSPENVREAITSASPDAVDVSSGVEASPGRKDIDKARRFIEAVRCCSLPNAPKKVFA